jgi:hypothetical protein
MRLLNAIMTIFLPAVLVCCGRPNTEKPALTELSIKDLEPNEIVHDSLSEAQIANIKRIQDVFSEVNSSSLEETINDFRRDQHPDKEIAIWLKMADAYQRFTSRTERKIEQNKKRAAYELVLLRSMMAEEEVLEKSKTEFLTRDEIKEILSYYLDQPDPLTVKKGVTP